MALSPINRTNLLALDPNLATGQVADPALRKAVFDQYADDMDTIIAAFNVLAAASGIGTTNIADFAVTTAKIALLAVTAAQIANGTITATQLADGAITSAKILDGTIVTVDLADAIITTAKLALLAVGTAQLADGAVTSSKIADATIVDADINSSAAIAWTKISKSGSNLTDLATRLITDLTGILAATQFPALTGDITTVAGTLATILKNTGVAGTYKSVTTDAQGRVTSGTNPTTISGFGITDAAPLTHVGAGGTAQHPDATTSQSGFISVADLIAFRALQATTGLSSYSVPVGQAFPWWSRYSQEQDPLTGEMVFYEI